MRVISKKFYTDYVNHMLRLYFNNVDGQVESGDTKDWFIVYMKVIGLVDWQKKILKGVFTNIKDCPMKDRVKEVSEELKCDETKIWMLLNVISKEIAKERGLI